MELTAEMSIIESLLEDIKYSANRLDSLSDKLDVKINGPHPVADANCTQPVNVGIISKLQEIKKNLGITEKSLEENIGKL